MICINNGNISPNFDGKAYLRGKWTEAMKEKFLSSPFLESMTKKHDLFVHSKRCVDYDSFAANNYVYMLSANAYSDKSHFNWLKDIFNLNSRKSFTHDFHTEQKTIDRFDDLHFNYLKRQLGLK